MERIIPIPAYTSSVIIVEYPLQTFNIRLSDSRTKLSLVFWCCYVEFFCIVPAFVALLSKLNSVNIFFNFIVILLLSLPFRFFFHMLFVNVFALLN